MYDELIYKQLKKYSRAQKGFHVPGHKGRAEFCARFPIAEMDITELSYSDNLFCPAGVIADAQRDIAQILGARKSFILTDGSSAGVMAMLCVAAKRGNKLIVPRNCHQSVWNACKLFNIEPVIVQGEYNEGVLTPPAPELIEQLIKNDVNIAGMVVTHPDYYGNMSPLGAYYSVLHEYDRLLIVDGAHGAHLAFEPERHGYAGVYADMWVDGAHKSLPVLTQGAVVSVNKEKLIGELQQAVAVFSTTSPSYPIMASVEYGVKYLANNPQALTAAKDALSAFKQKAAKFTFYPAEDWTKLLVDFKPLKISADAAARALEKKGIYAELSDGRYILFYLSPMTRAKDLNALYSALSAVAVDKKLIGTYKQRPPVPANERTYSFLYALKNRCEAVPLKAAAGRMCARNAGITPPCVPVLVAGEIITPEAIAALSASKNVFGLTEGKVWVVKK